MSTSNLERKFKLYWAALGGPKLQQEVRFHPTRKWQFDFALPALKVAIEVEGGVFSGGRHTRGAGYIKDCEKYNAATLMGWSVLRFTARTIDRKNMGPVIAFVHTRLLKIQSSTERGDMQ